ncbi:MAG: T9SS type A sorting domain-containing protein, partial [bacterium]|nr:T9SS type A sorting domain-containing protein [bacterium]
IPSSSSPNTRVYFIHNSSGTFPGLYRIDEDTGFSITHRVTPGILTEPGAEWKSISYDHTKDVIFLLYINSDKKTFGIRTINANSETLIDEFEILEISTTGHSIAVKDSSALNPLIATRLYVPGINVCNRFTYSQDFLPGNGVLEIDLSIGNPSFIFLWLGDIEAALTDFIFTADRGIFPQPTSNMYGLIDFESINIFGKVISYNIGVWGTGATNLFEPRGTSLLYNYNENKHQFYCVNRSTDIYSNYGKIFRFDEMATGFSTVEYYTGLSNPVGMDSFYTWLLTIENNPATNQSRVLMIDTHVNSPTATIPTEFAVSEYRSELDDPVDLAMDYIGRIYVLNKDSVVMFFLNPETWQIDFIREFPGVADIPIKSFGGIAVDSYGKIYVANNGDGFIYTFNPQGEILTKFGNGIGWRKSNFKRIEGIDFDSDGNLWISDSGNHRYQQVSLYYTGIEQEIVTITDNVGAPYVSLFSVSREEPVIAGPLEISVGFSEAMDTAYTPEVYVIDKEFGNIHPVTQTSYTGNNWTGTLTIQPNFGNGKATVIIRNAKDLDGHYIEDTNKFFKVNTNVSDIISNLTNFPNPFSPLKSTTRIQYYLNQPAFITIELIDLSGRLVKKKEISPGQVGAKEGFDNYFDWDGKTDSGVIVQNGVYILQITAKGAKTGDKMVLKRKVAVMK